MIPAATYFPSPAAFRAWLLRNHRRKEELWVGFHKRHTGKPSLTWSESVDEALCFGWIDGVRRSVDAGRYVIRFTPRRAGSNWSAVNVAKVAKLTEEGRMAPEGREAFERRTAARTQRYSYEQRAAARLDPAQVRTLRADARAWAHFEAQPPWYRRTAVHWVASAKRPETRARRFETLLAACAAGRRLGAVPASRAEGKPSAGRSR